MKFLAVSQNTGDPTPYIGAEAQKTAELQQSGVIETMLLKADWSGAVIVLNADDPDAADALLAEFPLVANGVARFDVTHVIEPVVPV